MSDQQQGRDSLSGCLLRVFWLCGGNAVLAVAGAQILLNAPPMFSRLDYADIRYFKGTTAEGNPSSIDDWRRHAFILALLAGAAWLLLHLAAHFLGPTGSTTPRGAKGEWPTTENRHTFGPVASHAISVFTGDAP
jgi:hypothetical protein